MKPCYFAEFNKDGKRPLGSDGVFILDGRNTLDNMERDARDQILRLKKVVSLNGYEIRYGSFSCSVLLKVSKVYL